MSHFKVWLLFAVLAFAFQGNAPAAEDAGGNALSAASAERTEGEEYLSEEDIFGDLYTEEAPAEEAKEEAQTVPLSVQKTS